MLATPFFLVFGRLSDRIGRKPVILGGCLIAAITLLPDLQPDDPIRAPAGHARTSGAAAGKFVGADGVTPTVAQPEILPLIALVWIQIIFVTMVYGPIAAFLVEFFPARIRYTSLSIPYHIGNGWFGGFLPLIAAALLDLDREPLRGAHLPDHRRADHGGRRRALHPREPARPDLGRGRWPRRGAGDRGATCAAPRHPQSIALKTLLRPR